jgi:lipopolysaccharide cholinephosphotransferase
MIDPKLLGQAQRIMLAMLIEFDQICKRHGLQYWLDSGTLLGAVRHRGFIPWDDDIDLSMPLEDYLKFQQLAQGELSPEIFFQTAQSDPGFRFDYIKLRSNRAKIVEFHELDRPIRYHQGVFVDIFPMLTIENSAASQRHYEETLSKIRSLSAKSLHTPDGIDDPTPRAELVAGLRQRHQGWQRADLKIIYGGEMPDVAAWFDITQVLPTAPIEFEGRLFDAPNNPDHYLKAIYRFDYRQLPPQDKRTTHAHSIELN